MRTPLQGFLCSIAILSILIAGTFAASRTEKTLKSPEEGFAFFSNCKKPGRRSETRSDMFVQSICIQFFEGNLAPPARVAVAPSVSQMLPSGIFIYGRVRGS